MLFSPGLIDSTVTHRIVGAFHAYRTNIDVGERECDEHDCCGRMDHIRSLHHLAALLEVREIEDETGNADGRAKHEYAQPEPYLLSGVELAGRHGLASDEIAKAPH